MHALSVPRSAVEVHACSAIPTGGDAVRARAAPRRGERAVRQQCRRGPECTRAASRQGSRAALRRRGPSTSLG
eukprot:3305449-Alexandrium_andersonii.AAC.1